MTSQSFLDQLHDLFRDRQAAGIRIVTSYTSATGMTVTPPAGTLRADGKDVNGEFQLPTGELAVTIDSWGSQASRMEIALEIVADQLGYPLVRFLDHNGDLLTTSVRLSHRHADATWRAAHAELKAAGVPVEDIRAATVTDSHELLRWFPTAIVLGWWHSHIASTTKKAATKQANVKKALGQAAADAMAGYAAVGEQWRSARLLTSEIIASGVHRRVRMPARQDTLFGPVARTPTIAPTELGVGSLPPTRQSEGPVDVTYTEVTGTAFFSLAGLRRYAFRGISNEDGHLLVTLLGLLMHALMQQDLRLRAGAELVITTPPHFEILRHGQPPAPLQPPDVQTLIELVRDYGQRAGWTGPIDVTIPKGSVLDTLLNKAELDTDE